MTEQDLREMPLHSRQQVDVECSVRRVPGGWIYLEWEMPNAPNTSLTSVFVPDLLAWEDAIACALRQGERIPARFKAGQDETEF